MMALLVTMTIIVVTMEMVIARDNGLALTPPMGFLTWRRFRCNRDCKNQPDFCLSENLIKTMANYLVKEGYLDLGYQYIIIDDCWLAPNRTADGSLQPDPDRFPSGIKALADYVHQLGLKFGIYEDFGTKTCAGYPGSEFYLMQDANTFAQWGVDYVKFDGCYSNQKDFDAGYEAFGFFLNRTGRPMVYSCEWPFIQFASRIKPNYTAVRETCNLWRNYHDLEDSWESVLTTIQLAMKDELKQSSYAGPGGWNDPDELTIGNYGLSYEQSKVQMGLWAIMAAPLLISTDLRTIAPEMKALLQNKLLTAINQDPLGVQGTFMGFINGTEITVWKKPLSGRRGTQAVALFQIPDYGDPTLIFVKAGDIGLTATNGYTLTDAFTGESLKPVQGPETVMEVLVNPNGIVIFVASPL